MSKQLLLLFNHTLTAAQQRDARASLAIDCLVAMPPAVSVIWGQVPSDTPAISAHLQPVRRWLRQQANPGDYVLIQGDFGACFLMVNFVLERGLIPVYATTRREAVESHQSDGSVKTMHHFRHQRFRKYGA